MNREHKNDHVNKKMGGEGIQCKSGGIGCFMSLSLLSQ